MCHLQEEQYASFLNQIPCEAVVCGFFFLPQLRRKHRYDVRGRTEQIKKQLYTFQKLLKYVLYILCHIYVYDEVDIKKPTDNSFAWYLVKKLACCSPYIWYMSAETCRRNFLMYVLIRAGSSSRAV